MNKVPAAVTATLLAFSMVACSDTGNPMQPQPELGSALFSKGGSSSVQSPNSGKKAKGVEVKGLVTAVSATSITIGTTVVPIDATTRFEKNEVDVLVTDILIGDRAEAKIPAGATIASKVEVE